MSPMRSTELGAGIFLAILSIVTTQGVLPNIQAMGRDLHLGAMNGDVVVDVNAGTQSLTDLFGNVDNIQSQTSTIGVRVDDNVDSITTMSSQLSTATSTIALQSQLISSASSTIASQSQLISSANSMLSAQSSMLLAQSSALDRMGCAMDASVNLGQNADPVPNQCNASTCYAACRSGYVASSGINLALNKVVSCSGDFNQSQIIPAIGSAQADRAVNGILNINSDGDRWVQRCYPNCYLAIDLGTMYTNISKFNFYSGHSSCSQVNPNLSASICRALQMCSHSIQVWTGNPATPLANAGQSSSGWDNVVSFPYPSFFGEEHAEVVPSVSARYVRLFIDNSGPRCDRLLPSSQYYARVREFQVMTGATQQFTCNGFNMVSNDADLNCQEA